MRVLSRLLFPPSPSVFPHSRLHNVLIYSLPRAPSRAECWSLNFSALRRRATEEKSHQKLPVSFERVSAPHLTEDSEELSSEDHDRSSAAIVPENCNRSNVRHQQCTSTHEEDGDMYPDYLSSAEGSGSRSGASEDNDDSDDSYDKEGDIAQAVDHHDHHHPYSDGYVGSASAWKATKTRKLASSASFGRPSYKHHHPHQVQHSNIMMSRSYSTSGAGLSRRHRRSSRPQLRITAQELANIAAGAALALAVLAPLAQALSSHWQYFVAGGICAAASHTAAVPLDVIKTRIQVLSLREQPKIERCFCWLSILTSSLYPSSSRFVIF